MNLLEKYYLQGKGKLMAGIFVLVVLLIISTIAFTGCFSSGKKSDDKNTVTVFNYGDYIDVSVLKTFEKETGIKVKYEEYVTPEDMYTKYKSGVINYDVICTSDYMVEKMMQEGEAQKIDTSSMEYYKNIDEKYLDFCKAFDTTNEYAVPYLWGTVGILYNTKVIKEKVDSWSILWDKKYDDQIVMQNSMRDAFMVPLKWNGISLNTTSRKELKQAQSLLLKQKPIVEAYLVDGTSSQNLRKQPFSLNSGWLAGGMVFSSAEWLASVTWKLVTPACTSRGTNTASSSSTTPALP